MICHIGGHFIGNAGDIILYEATRKLFCSMGFPDNYVLWEQHDQVNNRDLELLNSADFILLGGGGVFIRDTKANPNSGWQWNCSLSALCGIKKPLVLFGVGYNRFRTQEEFDPIFRKHINAVARRTIFFGPRHNGDVRKLKSYMSKSEKLDEKLCFQPCPTTMMSLFWKTKSVVKRKVIAINIAYDREHFRISDDKKERELIYDKIALAAKEAIALGYKIEIVTHCPVDDQAVAVFTRNKVPCKIVRLEFLSASAILEYYKSISMCVGMRGHSQMVAFGVGVPFFSIVSHDKVGFFLDDIKQKKWGCEIKDKLLQEKIVKHIRFVDSNLDKIKHDISIAKNKLWKITINNFEKIKGALNA